MKKHAARALGLALLLNLLLVAPANAYIDPGTTTIVFQAVVAAIAAAGVSLGMFWSRVKSFFRRDDDQGDQDDLPAAETEASAGDA